MDNPKTIPGKTYAVTSPNGCTVTTPDGLTLVEIEAGKQGYFVAVGSKVILSDDSAILTPLFKLAPYQKLRLLGVVGGNAGNGGLPAGFKRVEYLESTGTQYINADIVNNDSDLWAIFSINPDELGEDMKFFGAGCVALCILNSKFRGTSVNTTSDIYEFHGWQGVQKGINPGTLYNANTKELFESTSFWNPYANGKEEPTIVFGVYSWGSLDTRTYIKLYQFEAKNKTAHRKMVPCLDETGAPCMFDTVSRKPFYNSGRGDFLYPSETTTYSLRRVLPDWGKLTERGLRRLYHAPSNYKGELYDYALENGYKPIVEPEKPEEGYWSPRWTETEEEIVLEWVETEPPTDEFGMPEETLTTN